MSIIGSEKGGKPPQKEFNMTKKTIIYKFWIIEGYPTGCHGPRWAVRDAKGEFQGTARSIEAAKELVRGRQGKLQQDRLRELRAGLDMRKIKTVTIG